MYTYTAGATGLDAAMPPWVSRACWPGTFAMNTIDPATIQDHATYERPHQLATGVNDVWVNGVQALKDGVATGAASGKFVHGRAWTGAGGGGCRSSSHDWTWSK
jgi:N-acyl-D-amino-acid deacylase